MPIKKKNRVFFSKEYLGRDFWIEFTEDDRSYSYPHDKCLKEWRELKNSQGKYNIRGTKSWEEIGEYHYPYMTKALLEFMEPYRIAYKG